MVYHQACAHCAIFFTAASRREFDRVSVPVLVILQTARIVALVSRYSPTSNLIWAISDGKRPEGPLLVLRRYAV